MMHQRCWTLFVMLTLLWVPIAFAEPVIFTLTNGTDEAIMEFYASPPGVDEWEEDILGEGVLEPGESIEITIADGREDCDYDLLAVYEDESEAEHEAVAICDGEHYVFEFD